ncbi:hypothetical protein [Amycolatopsis sp. EV170708-02-1]|uniref:hypothetical protein n=1 Tax=Amycolatopsis sp. EV170708-02-1 TaxID=2919322 RepID=UPI001F0CC58A|nr:hypothetical protein [Amycolatopsis sp. EV170708-02-1]UMP06687.1 hypothetical protein MJQ72_18585 [Amycolatopsis sp. EV170708-02-1]
MERDTNAPGTEDTRPDTTAIREAATSPAADDAPEAAATDTTVDDGARAATTADVENGTSPLPNSASDAPGDSATGTGPSVAESPADTNTSARDKERLPKGDLRALVEEYLADHPGDAFGPARIGKDLGRSGGAVNNALEKLVADGVRAQDLRGAEAVRHQPGQDRCLGNERQHRARIECLTPATPEPRAEPPPLPRE